MNYVCNGSYRSFVCLDFETTGLSAANDRITEIGAIKVTDGKLVTRFSTLVNPSRAIPYRVVSLTGITNEMVADSPVFRDVLPHFLEFVGELPIVAHNAKFDGRFLEAELVRQGLCFGNSMDDTMLVAKRKCRGLPSYRLGYLTDYFNIPLQNAHRAWCDAEATARLYLHMQTL